MAGTALAFMPLGTRQSLKVLQHQIRHLYQLARRLLPLRSIPMVVSEGGTKIEVIPQQ